MTRVETAVSREQAVARLLREIEEHKLAIEENRRALTVLGYRGLS